ARSSRHRLLVLYSALALLAIAGGALAQDAKRGLYVSKAAGCLGCHTETRPNAQPYAGARALATPFGPFFGPNLTTAPPSGRRRSVIAGNAIRHATGSARRRRTASSPARSWGRKPGRRTSRRRDSRS